MVLLHLMNRVVAEDGNQMIVEVGMTLLELARAAQSHVPVGAMPMDANLTVGGVMILTGAHGNLGDLATSLKWVNAKGQVLVHERDTGEFRALVGGLGLLGIVTEVTLQLQLNSRTIVEVRKGLNNTRIVPELVQMVQHETPHAMTFWRPDFGKYKSPGTSDLYNPGVAEEGPGLLPALLSGLLVLLCHGLPLPTRV